jgi:DNA-binding response OmpR family regulator
MSSILLDVAPTVRDANNYLEQNGYECVLLDLSLAEEIGIDFLKLHLRGRDQPWPVIILIGSREIEQIVRAIKLGAKDYFLKDRLPGPKILQSRMIVAI